MLSIQWVSSGMLRRATGCLVFRLVSSTEKHRGLVSRFRLKTVVARWGGLNDPPSALLCDALRVPWRLLAYQCSRLFVPLPCSLPPLCPASTISQLSGGMIRMCVCVCVCMHACMYVCMYVYTYVCMYVFMYVCVYACMHVCMCVCMYACTYVCVHVCL